MQKQKTTSNVLCHVPPVLFCHRFSDWAGICQFGLPEVTVCGEDLMLGRMGREQRASTSGSHFPLPQEQVASRV